MKHTFGILGLVLLLLLAPSSLLACSRQQPAPTEPMTQASATAATTAAPAAATTSSAKVPIRLACLKGPTGIGLVHLMAANENGTSQNPYTFSVHGSADEITPRLIKGDLDLAAIPANLAAVLYNNTEGQIVLLAVNTVGVSYLVETGKTVQDFADLRGRTIYATGKGSSPEYALRYLLQQNGLDPDKDVTLEWKSEPTEIVALLSETPDAVAMLPQPYVAVAQGQVPGLRIAIDLNAAWQDLHNQSLMITGVLVGRRDFVASHRTEIKNFLSEYQESTRLANADVAATARLAEKYGIVAAAAAEKAIPACNITFLDGADMKQAMNGYLNVLFTQNPKSVGGKLPDDAFYFQP
jgi:NitT/TauT family transport system substrate-binding protein